MKPDKIYTALAFMAGVSIFIGIKVWLDRMNMRVEPPEPRERMKLAALRNVLEFYKVDNGAFPGGMNGLDDLIIKPTNASAEWHGPYLDKIPLDAWGHPYRYEYPGRHNTNSFDLSSAGPDGVFGTKDDIVNWQK